MLPSPLFASLAVLTIWTVVLGLIVGRFELFLAAVPLVVALLSARKPVAASSIGITANLSSMRLTEGDRLDLVVDRRLPPGDVTVDRNFPAPAEHL